MPLTKLRYRMIEGAVPMVTDFNPAAGDGTTDARTAIFSAMTEGACYFPPGTYRIASSLTITGVVYMAPGAVLRPIAGVVVTFSGSLVTEQHRIFDTSLGGSFVTDSNVALSKRITHSHPEWWGATGIAGDQSPFIQAAINFIQGTTGGTVFLNGWYTCNQGLFVTGRVRIEGFGPVYGVQLTGIERSATLDFSGAPSGQGGILVQNGNLITNGFELINVGMFRNPVEPKTAVSVGLNLAAVQHFRVHNCAIFGFAICAQVGDVVNAMVQASFDGVFDNCSIGSAGRTSLVLHGCSAISFHDCTMWTDQRLLDQIVSLGRGVGGFRSDTITFADCRILYLNPDITGRPTNSVLITDGMWINFIRTDIEEAANCGVLVQRDAAAGDHDIGLKQVDISNCWFNGTGRAVIFSGRRVSGRVSDCRIENSGGATPNNISVEFTVAQDADIVIRGNNIRASGSLGGITITNASGVRIMENYIYGEGSGASAPGITLASSASNCIVTGNRVRSNHAGPISNGGTNNVVANNIITGT